MAKDPICGMMVNEKKAQLKSTHEGVTFYFCSLNCKRAFDSDPHKGDIRNNIITPFFALAIQLVLTCF